MRRSVLTVYILLIFLSGLAVGGYGLHFYQAYQAQQAENERAERRWGPEEYRKGYIEVLSEQLSLTDEQIRLLEGIMDHTRERYEELESEVIRPRQEEILQQQEAEIDTILTAEQRETLESFRKERDARRRRPPMEQGPPPGVRPDGRPAEDARTPDRRWQDDSRGPGGPGRGGEFPTPSAPQE